MHSSNFEFHVIFFVSKHEEFVECSASDEIKNVFEAKGGRKPHTEGIHILGNPFLLEIKQHGKLKKVKKYIIKLGLYFVQPFYLLEEFDKIRCFFT